MAWIFPKIHNLCAQKYTNYNRGIGYNWDVTHLFNCLLNVNMNVIFNRVSLSNIVINTIEEILCLYLSWLPFCSCSFVAFTCSLHIHSNNLSRQYMMKYCLHLTVEYLIPAQLEWQSTQNAIDLNDTSRSSSCSSTFFTLMLWRGFHSILHLVQFILLQHCQCVNIWIQLSHVQYDLLHLKHLKCYANTGGSTILAVVIWLHHLNCSIIGTTEEKLPECWQWVNSKAIVFWEIIFKTGGSKIDVIISKKFHSTETMTFHNGV